MTARVALLASRKASTLPLNFLKFPIGWLKTRDNMHALHYAVQGHLRSPISVSTAISYTTSYGDCYSTDDCLRCVFGPRHAAVNAVYGQFRLDCLT